ncbi:hypothetical protein ABZS94_43550, partial [Streptomyces sp. NPDC005500]
MDELMRRRPRRPGPGPRPGHEHVEPVGGPLDGLLLDVAMYGGATSFRHEIGSRALTRVADVHERG